MPEHRFPPPWSVEELAACFVVRDHNGQALAYVYFEDEAQRRMKLVTSDLVAHKGQIPCKRYCKLGHRTPYSRHQQWRGPCYKSPNERW